MPAIYLTDPIGGANGSYDIGWIVEEIDPVFDLALTNTVDPSSIPADGTFDNGDTIIFSVNVINQGNVDGTDIVIADIVPCGMQVFDETIPTNDSTGWSALDADTTRITIDSLSAGMSMQIPIAMIVEVPAVGCPVETLDPYMNFTYVESANDDMGMPAGDIDSELGPLTAEELAVKPNMAGDNDIESSGNTDIGSQDDSDPANIDIFDLALSNILSPNNSPYAYGDTATFEICVTNQGNVPTDSIVIVDYIPLGYTFSMSNNTKWTDNMDGTATYHTDASDFPGGAIEFLEQVCVDINLIVQQTNGGEDDYTNTAEIAGATTLIDPDGPGPLGELSTFVTSDNDGDFDTDPNNDAGGLLGSDSDAMTSETSDPAIQGNGTGMPRDGDAGTDTDDADIASIQVFDLALVKTLNPTLTNLPVSPGDLVVYDISIYNQGNIDAYDIQISDYVPEGFILADTLWQMVEDTAQLRLPVDHILAGDSSVVRISMQVAPLFQDTSIINNAEIEHAEDVAGVQQQDIDSTPGDADGSTPDSTDNDTADTDGGDDYDPAEIAVDQTFDLALAMVVAESGPFVPGDKVTYTITVHNQGSLDATDVEITDTPPVGMMIVDSAWTDNTFLVGNLAAGASTAIDVELMIGATFQGTSLVNNAEITAAANALGLEDEDGAISIIDGGVAGDESELDTDNDIDDDGVGTPGTTDNAADVDDYDPAEIAVEQTFDLALAMVATESGPFVPGDTVSYTITVHNQGTLDATDVEITDTPPVGMMIVDSAWTDKTFFVGNLAAGASMAIDVELMIDATFQGTSLVNNAEITAAANALELEDEDGAISIIDGGVAGDESELDTDNDIDDDAAGTPGTADNADDVDDYDPAEIAVDQTFDLALSLIHI